MDRHIIGNLKMPEYTGTTADCAVPADARATGDAHATCDRGVITDNDVMCDMHEIINLHPITDNGIVECSAINRGVRADLDVIANDHGADLFHLDPCSAIQRKAETIGTDDRARLNDNTPSDPRAIHDHAIGIEISVATNLDASTNEGTGTDMNPRPNPTCRTDSGPGTNPRGHVDRCSRMHHGAVLDARGKAAR